MDPTTIYNFPARASTDYAVRQEEYDRQTAEQMLGAGEALASQAATVHSLVRQLPATTVLFGLELKTTIAQFPPLPGAEEYRSLSILEAPSLGSGAKRKADRQKVLDKLESLPDKGGVEDNLAGMRIAQMIEQTEKNNREILYTQSQMGSVMGA